MSGLRSREIVPPAKVGWLASRFAILELNGLFLFAGYRYRVPDHNVCPQCCTDKEATLVASMNNVTLH